MQVDSFDSAKDTMMATLAAMLKRLSNYQKLLYACQSCTAIEIRKREVEKLAADFAAKAAADCTCLLATANETCDAIRTANRRCAPYCNRPSRLEPGPMVAWHLRCSPYVIVPFWRHTSAWFGTCLIPV